ncbi:flavin reductase family protein [Thermoleophilum album]|uniref:flavin reductase family protein n=1 Tax=Thermoleophilum album TaxID=29539 RepID=UPI00237D117D|nr:flavin reductase family protein [Thermoleophilum album]WDT93120.1 flavin reductase family protein [Thermoleophilum album]
MDQPVSDSTLARFREAMALLPAGVCVVTARDRAGAPRGLAATSVTSFSTAPPSLVVSIAASARSHAAIAAGERFAVHLLRASDGLAIAERFATKDDDKFAAVAWDWEDGVPRLRDALWFIRCRRSATFDHHDHSLVIGDAEKIEVADGEPLLYARRRMDWFLQPGA